MVTVAIIDDNKELAQQIKNQLSDFGYTLIVATSGEDGLDIIRKHMPDVIILDVVLPDMNGWLVSDLLKVEEKLKHIPIIFLTGKGGSDTQRNASYAGDDLLIKPVSAQVLHDHIQKVLQQA